MTEQNINIPSFSHSQLTNSKKSLLNNINSNDDLYDILEDRNDVNSNSLIISSSSNPISISLNADDNKTNKFNKKFRKLNNKINNQNKNICDLNLRMNNYDIFVKEIKRLNLKISQLNQKIKNKNQIIFEYQKISELSKNKINEIKKINENLNKKLTEIENNFEKLISENKNLKQMKIHCCCFCKCMKKRKFLDKGNNFKINEFEDFKNKTNNNFDDKVYFIKKYGKNYLDVKNNTNKRASPTNFYSKCFKKYPGSEQKDYYVKLNNNYTYQYTNN